MANVIFKAHNHRVLPELESPPGPNVSRPRSQVGGFSRFSRWRLMELFYSFQVIPFKTFWTLTFDKDVKPEYAKKELHRLLMQLNRRGVGNLWLMEFTARGRIHFHLALTDFLSHTWVKNRWGNGHVYVSKIYAEIGLRKYFLKECSKSNQKGFHGFCGRWWGVSRALNKKYSLGVYDDSYLDCLVANRGIKWRYWREDLQGLIDNPYSNFNNFREVKLGLLKNKLHK